MNLEYCLWVPFDTFDGDEAWSTDCGNDHQFMNDGPKENNYRYCPYCGHQIVLDAPDE